MAVDTLSRRALLVMKRDNDYAPRVKTWPPDGYVVPTAEEFAELLIAAQRHQNGYTRPSYWNRKTGAEVLRHAQLCELTGALHGPLSSAVYGYARALRAELRRRDITYRSMALLRCEACSHGSERLFEVTQETHPGLKSQRGPVTSAWYCAQCWSGRTWDGDEDETEDEG